MVSMKCCASGGGCQLGLVAVKCMRDSSTLPSSACVYWSGNCGGDDCSCCCCCWGGGGGGAAAAASGSTKPCQTQKSQHCRSLFSGVLFNVTI